MSRIDHHQELLDRAHIKGVERRDLPEQLTAATARTLDLADVGSWISEAIARVAAVVASQQIDPVGPPYARYFSVGDHRFHVETGLPVQREIIIQAEVGPTSLPAGPVLVTVHAGPYDQVSDAYERIEAWATEHDVTTGGDPWEVYLTDPNLARDPAQWRTEVVVPVAPAAEPEPRTAVPSDTLAEIADAVIAARLRLAATVEQLRAIPSADDRTSELLRLAVDADEAVVRLAAAVVDPGAVEQFPEPAPRLHLPVLPTIHVPRGETP